MSMKIALAFLMLAPALAQESTCSGEEGGQCEGGSASPMVDEHALLQASASMHSQQLDVQSSFLGHSARMSAVKRCSLSLISKATKTKAPPSGCEEFGADLEKTVKDETIPAIESGVANDQKMHDLAEGGVNKCNEALSTDSNLVANGANDVDVARKLHIECRSVEATHFDASEAKSQALTSFLGSPSDPCGGTYPSDWKALAECFETQVNYHKQMNTTLYEKVEAYTKAHDAWQAKKVECTTSQAHFEVTYCGRHHLVENTIKKYDQCWEEATQSYEKVKVAVTASFDNHVKEYIAAQRLICLAQATKLTEEPTKAQAQLDHCHNMEVDTSKLTLNIPADFPPEKKTPNFGVPSVYPGHPSWVGQEYAGLSAAKSPHAAVTPCAHIGAGAGVDRVQLKYTKGLCLSMKSGKADAGCDASSCKGNGNSDATLQTCAETGFQLWRYDESTKLLHSDAFGCLTVGTSGNHGACEPFTLTACSSGNERQQFNKESAGGSTVWRNVKTNLAIDVNSYANKVDNWVWACPGTNSAKYFDPITVQMQQA